MKKITLCGSTKFKKEFDQVNAMLSLEGHVVYSCAIFGHNSNIDLSDDEKEILDHVHKLKIINSDEIYVIDVDGYIGESTRSEIEYAESFGMSITFLRDDMERFNKFVNSRLKGVKL